MRRIVKKEPCPNELEKINEEDRKKGPCLKERDPLLRLGAFFPARRPPRRQPFDACAHDGDGGDDDDDVEQEGDEQEEVRKR